MGESMGSPLHGEGHHTRRPRYSQQFLPPFSAPRNMLHASNLNKTSRSATRQSESVVQAREKGAELVSGYTKYTLIPDLPKYLKLVASPPNQSLCSTVALRLVW